MSCNCKEETYSGVKKYSDDGAEVLVPKTFVGKVFSFIFRLVFGILLSVIVIIALPFAVLYTIFVAIFGKGVSVNIKKVFKLNG